MQHVLIDGIKYDLPALEKDCWNRLINGAVQGRNAMHNAVVANMGQAGISMRTVVLRKTLPVEKQLVFYTDIRSGKWAELQRENNISWLFYDAGARVQIRAAGIASLHQNDVWANQAWDSTSVLNRKNYLSVLAPSTITELPETGIATDSELDSFTAEQSELARANFGVVLTKINWIEWLWLNNDGHRRANFIYREDGGFTANWLTP